MAANAISGRWRVKVTSLPTSITIEQLAQSLHISSSRVCIPKTQGKATYYAWINDFDDEQDANEFVLQNAQLIISNLHIKCSAIESKDDSMNFQHQPRRCSVDTRPQKKPTLTNTIQHKNSQQRSASAARVSTQTPDTECERHSRRQNYDSCLPSNCLLAHTQGLPSKQCLNDIQDYLHPLQPAEPSKPIVAMPLAAYNKPNIFPGSTKERPREVIELSIAEQNFLEYFGDKILDKIRKEQGIEDVKVKDGKLQLSGNSLTITNIKSYLKQVLHEQNVIIPNSLKKYLQLSAKGCLMKRFLQKYSLGISYLEISTNPSLNTNDIITIKNRANDHDKYEREKQYDSDRDMDQSEDDDDDNRKNDVSNTSSNVANISSNLKHCRLYAQKFIQLTLCNDSKDLLSKAIKELKSYSLYTQLWVLTQDEITYILKQPQSGKPSQ
ncbi:unnamed protein product, partial [Rotaria sordida]